MRDLYTINVDYTHMHALKDSLSATDAQFRAAYHRAAARTAKNVLTAIKKIEKQELQVAQAKKFRKRFQYFRRGSFQDGRFETFRFWFGLNDIAIHYLKGTSRWEGRKQNRTGATFTPRSRFVRQKRYTSPAFIGRLYHRRSIWARTSAHRYPVEEARVSIQDGRLKSHIEQTVSAVIDEKFMQHFETDLIGRVKTGMNRSSWQR